MAKATENNNTHRPGVGISVPAFKLTRRHQGLRPPVTNATARATSVGTISITSTNIAFRLMTNEFIVSLQSILGWYGNDGQEIGHPDSAQYTPLVMNQNGTASVELPLEDGGGSGGRPPRAAPMVQPAKSRSALSHRSSVSSPGSGAHGRRVKGVDPPGSAMAPGGGAREKPPQASA